MVERNVKAPTGATEIPLPAANIDKPSSSGYSLFASESAPQRTHKSTCPKEASP